MEWFGVTKSLGFLSPTMSHWCLGPPGPCSVTMDPWLHEVSQCSNALLGSRVSHNGLLVPRGTTVSNRFPSFHESLRSNTGPLVPWSPAVSQWPHHYMRSCSVTMLCMVPQGPAVSQWPLGSMRPPSATMNSLVLQCHNGALVTQDPAVSPGTLGSMGHHSVTIFPLVPRVLAMEQWPLDSIGPQALPRLSLVPQCHNVPLVPLALCCCIPPPLLRPPSQLRNAGWALALANSPWAQLLWSSAQTLSAPRHCCCPNSSWFL